MNQLTELRQRLIQALSEPLQRADAVQLAVVGGNVGERLEVGVKKLFRLP